MRNPDRSDVLHELLHQTVLDLIITFKFLPREIIAEMFKEMGWLRTLPRSASREEPFNG